MHGDTSWVCHRHSDGQAAHDTALQAKEGGVDRCTMFAGMLTAKAAPHTRSDSESVQTLPKEKTPVMYRCMPKSSLGG